MILGLLLFFGGYWLFCAFFWKVLMPMLSAMGEGEPRPTTAMQGNVVVRAAIRRNSTLRDVETGRPLVADTAMLMSCRPKDIRSN